MRYLALFILSCLAWTSSAMTHVDLYGVSVVIDREQEDGDALARRQALEQVIVRTTGDKSASQNPVIAKALAGSARYVSQLSYTQLDDGATQVNFRFNQEQISALLTQAQLPFWAPERRNVLVWLVEENQFERQIVWEHTASEFAASLRQEAAKRGVPVTFPIGDFDDVTGVQIADLWGGFVTPLSAASQRYPVEAVLLVRLQGDTLRWTLYDAAPAAMTATMETPLTGVASGIDAPLSVIDALANQFAQKDAVVVSSESTESVDVTFLNVRNALDFFTLEKSLSALNSVAALDILQIQGDHLTVRVHLLAQRAAFEQQMSQLPRLQRFIDEFAAPQASVSGPTPALDSIATADDNLVTPVALETIAVPTTANAGPLVFEWLAP
ncbi:DUF2066 domain-containing protein [Vibrio sp. SM6]|uniref:DUF2066 domain-containing protein n=1 Tax=Vibrio agarilyticus TaxID=2726741 RepID=A0A7X8TQX0_9VIBR|nr:DUF2066 domain-containing protein [Vibrio agarilyticus]NLS13188.1 DUF2066 domain-containing protein [Vibrio agarilyticus]